METSEAFSRFKMDSYKKTTKILLISTHFVLSIYCMELSNVMDAYKARCGDTLCEMQISDRTNGKLRDYCPECSCDTTCIFSRNCCPDKYFRFPQSCIETSIVNFNPFHNEKRSVSMISHCPVSSDNVTKTNCEISTSLDQKLQHIPVYSSKSGLSYRNVHCSVCHNESTEIIIQWKIEIECANFADFNFLSSYSEIIDYAREKKCDIVYSSSDINGVHINTCDDRYLLDGGLMSKCNVSGTWILFDASIDYACRMYENKFYSFKNVFCHLCNPPIDVGGVISKCNSTGLWDVFNADLEKACLNNIQSPLTTPFRNIYCFLCNSNNNTKTDYMHFNEIEFTLDEWIENHREFVLEFATTYVNLESVFEGGSKYLKDTKPDIIATTKLDVIKNYYLNILNRTHIMVQYFAFTGSPLFCQNYSMFPMTKNCDCSDSCFFQDGCCVDKLIERSSSCTDPRYSYDETGYVVFDTCTKSINDLAEKLCRINDIETFFTFQPVEIQIADVSTHYKNIFCAVCSDVLGQSTLKNTDFTSLKLWDLVVRCNVYLPPFFFLSFEKYFRFVRENGCDIKYIPSDYTMSCEEKEYKQCNVTGHWMHRDQDIEFVCENITTSKSAFCSICNPKHNQTIEYSECNVTGSWENYDIETEKYCLNMPIIDYLAPYKNIFCKICNGVAVYEDQSGSGSAASGEFGSPNSPKPPSYRIIFKFSNNNQPSKHNKETPRCNLSQIVFLNECRDIHCYPGRMPVDTGCTPLFQTTENLGYILYGSLKASLLNNVNDSMPFLESVGESFMEYVRIYLKLASIYFETSFTFSNSYCPRNQLNKLYKGLDVLILVYHKLFITDSVNRSKTEEQLISLLGSSFNITYDDFEQPFRFEHDANAFHLPSIVTRMKFTDKCYTINETSRSHPGHFYVHSHVNQLLFCEQIELNENEFSVNLKDLKLTIFSRNTDIEPDDYMLMSTRKARLCVNRLQTLNKRNDFDHSAEVWNTLAFVLTCISLVCLVLTFLTYCCFSSLRTLPGKNNMCLVFAMFCAQFVFLFVEFGTKSDIGCKVIGVLIHYFWLVSFGCLNVCSFHMFYVFTSKTGIHISETYRLAVYILYSYGIPAIVVVLNIIITRSLSSVTLIGYGGHLCFLNQQIAFFVTFLIPISLVCFSNIFFFIGTALKIARRPKLKNDSQMSLNQIQFSVYVKLFSITGITWIFQIIDSFIPFSAFSTIISLLNALQGVFIFISYVCNRRVLNFYKQTRMSLSENSNSKTSRHTTSTELSGM